MTELDEKKQKTNRANILLAIGLGLVALFAMLITMYALSGAKLPT